MPSMPSHLPQFLGQILTRPAQVGAILPSSRFLGQEMTADLDADSGPVIELGPGSGAITRVLLRRGVCPTNLHVIEMNPRFCDVLRQRCPGVDIHCASATDLNALHLPNVTTIVSSLPLLSIPKHVVEAVLIAARAQLAPGGRIRQFTYGTGSPVLPSTLARLGFECVRGPTVWRNIPPARIFTFIKSS